jgi:hypothetical protein
MRNILLIAIFILPLFCFAETKQADNLNLLGYRLINMGEPIGVRDATTKQYVLATISSSSSNVLSQISSQYVLRNGDTLTGAYTIVGSLTVDGDVITSIDYFTNVIAIAFEDGTILTTATPTIDFTALTNEVVIDAATRDIVISNDVISWVVSQSYVDANITNGIGGFDPNATNQVLIDAEAYTDIATQGCLQTTYLIPVDGAQGVLYSPDALGSNIYISSVIPGLTFTTDISATGADFTAMPTSADTPSGSDPTALVNVDYTDGLTNDVVEWVVSQVYVDASITNDIGFDPNATNQVLIDAEAYTDARTNDVVEWVVDQAYLDETDKVTIDGAIGVLYSPDVSGTNSYLTSDVPYTISFSNTVVYNKIWLTSPTDRTNMCMFFTPPDIFVKQLIMYTNATDAITNQITTDMTP